MADQTRPAPPATTSADSANLEKLAADPAVRTERYTVRSYELDPKAELHVPTVLNYIQETAGIDVLARGPSTADLTTRQRAWLLSRIALRISSSPRWRDELLLHTWASGTKGRLLARRDFLVTRPSGAVVAQCASAWLLFDLTSRRPVRVDGEALAPYPQREVQALEHPLNKLPAPPPGGDTHRFTVRYRDLDVNQHVNNARYAEYVVTSAPPTLLSEQRLVALEINYLAEARLGDVVTTRCLPAEDGTSCTHSMEREADGQELARAHTRWAPR